MFIQLTMNSHLFKLLCQINFVFTIQTAKFVIMNTQIQLNIIKTKYGITCVKLTKIEHI